MSENKKESQESTTQPTTLAMLGKIGLTAALGVASGLSIYTFGVQNYNAGIEHQNVEYAQSHGNDTAAKEAQDRADDDTSRGLFSGIAGIAQGSAAAYFGTEVVTAGAALLRNKKANQLAHPTFVGTATHFTGNVEHMIVNTSVKDLK